MCKCHANGDAQLPKFAEFHEDIKGSWKYSLALAPAAKWPKKSVETKSKPRFAVAIIPNQT